MLLQKELQKNKETLDSIDSYITKIKNYDYKTLK